MDRTDVVVRGLIQLQDEECLNIVAAAMAGMHGREAVQATVQISLALARSMRADVISDVCCSSRCALSCANTHARLLGLRLS